MATTAELEYNKDCSKYIEWKNSLGDSVRSYTIFECMIQLPLDERGLLTGKRILDLACGDGRFTRRLNELNCDYILGVDISSTIIDFARRAERHSPKGIEYKVADVRQLFPPEHPFDLVTAFHLLNYAGTRDELFEMVRTIYLQLGENKHFIGMTMYVVAGKDIFNTDKYRKYGLAFYTKTLLDDNPIADGTEVTFTLYNKGNETISTFTNYYFSPATYEQVFKEAGFNKFQLIPCQCDPDEPNKVFYDDLVNCPAAIGIIAIK